MNQTCPCKDCKRRFLGCHSSCGEYKTWKNLKETERTERQTKRMEEYDYAFSQRMERYSKRRKR
jgi:hypothetical protein